MTLAERMRANAALLDAQIGRRTITAAHLQSLVADLRDQAAEAERLAEAAAWLGATARVEPFHPKAAA